MSMISLFVRGAINVALNSGSSYVVCKMAGDADYKHLMTTIAIDTTYRIATMHLLSFAFGKEKVENSGNMVHFSFLVATGLIQPLSVYLADKVCTGQKKDWISTFGYIALCWKINMLIKDIVRSLKVVDA